MNKKRYLILIAIVIFIFLALFTFANPLNNGEENDNRVLEEIEEEDVIEQEEVEVEEKEEVIKPIVVPQYNNHGVTINKVTEVEDKSYEFAKEAVEKAEITLSIDDLVSASKLVEKVKDEDKKEELEEKLGSVLEIIELNDLVDTLVEDVKSAKNKTDMDSARKFVETNDLEKRIDNLSNKLVKGLLIDKLETISSLVDDEEAPTINIEDGAIFDEDTKIIVTDESDVTIKLNDEEIENNEIVSDGVYELTVTDASFNTKTVEFIVDTTAPEFVVGEESVGNGEYYSKLFLTLKDDNLKYLEINGIGDHAISPFEIASEYYKKGENVLVATDAAGNKTIFTFNYVTNVNILEENTKLETDEKLEISEGETYVLDLNNNIFTVNNNNAPRNIINKGTLVIKNGKMINSNTGTNYGLIDNYGTLVVDNVEFIDNGTGDGSTIKNRGGNITIKNSSFKNTGVNYGNAGIYSDGILNVENIEFESSSERAYPLIVNSGQATIKSVKVTGTHGGLCVNAGTVVVENLEYNADIHYGIFITNNGGLTGTEETNITINGGIFNGELYGLFAGIDDGLQDKSDVTITINEGIFKGNNGAMHLAGDKSTIHNWNVTINGGTFEGNIIKGNKYNTEKWNLTINSGKFKNSVASDLTLEYEEILNTETGYYEVTEKNA